MRKRMIAIDSVGNAFNALVYGFVSYAGPFTVSIFAGLLVPVVLFKQLASKSTL